MGSSEERLDVGGASGDAVRVHLGKVASSRAFANASRLSRFLRFVVEERLAGRPDRIQEYVLGIEVFDRKETFDPRIDSIVRVEGRRLRVRLAEYYRTEGRADTLRIELPNRGYIPEFRTVPASKRLLRWFRAAGVLTGALVAVAVIFWQSTRDRHGSAPGSARIGVLPFANLSADPDQEYFAQGIMDALITELASIPALRVISRTSMMRHAGDRKSAPEVARELGARYLLEGTVFRSGRRVRLTAQLIDGTTDQHIWAHSYDREVTDLLRVQADLVRQISREIRIQLAPEVEKDLAEAPTVRERALDAYLKGRFAQEQRTADAAARSAKFFEEAVAEEPGFALAHAWLAASYRTSFIMGDSPAREMLPRATAAARKAVELAPRLGEARSSLAMCHSLEWNWPAAEREFMRALELSPGSSDAHHRYAIVYLAPLGRLGEAESEIRRAVELDRTSLNNRVILAKILYFQRRYDDGAAELREVMRMDPNYPDGLRNLAAVYVQMGKYEQAVAAYGKAQAVAPTSWVQGLIAHAQAVAGEHSEANRTLRELIGRRGHGQVSASAVAAAYVGLRAFDQGLEWLERARTEQDWQLIFLKVDPMYDPLRSDSRFQSLLNAVGLN